MDDGNGAEGREKRGGAATCVFDWQAEQGAKRDRESDDATGVRDRKKNSTQCTATVGG